MTTPTYEACTSLKKALRASSNRLLSEFEGDFADEEDPVDDWAFEDVPPIEVRLSTDEECCVPKIICSVREVSDESEHRASILAYPWVT